MTLDPYKKNVVLIALIFDDLYCDKGTGVPKHRDHPSVLCVRRLIETVDIKKENALIICTTGFGKKSPECASEKRLVSLADQLSRYLRDNSSLVYWHSYARITPKYFNIEDEILEGVDHVRVHVVNYPDTRIAEVRVFAPQTYWLRVWVATQMDTPTNIKVLVGKIDEPFSLLSCIRQMWWFIKNMALVTLAVSRSKKREKTYLR